VNIVVGSGPAGVAAASALLDAGRETLMLDIGRTLETDRRGGEADPSDPARKLAFGSAYPYQTARESGLDQRGVKCLASAGKGGLSAVWGASVLPFPEDELDGWPVRPEELRPHYAKAAALLGLAGERDALEARFPFHAPPRPSLRPSRQARAVLARLAAAEPALKAAGATFGRARHAVDAARCSYDGTCLEGCAPGAIWNAASAVDALVRRGMRYERGARVLAFDEAASGPRVFVAREGASRAVIGGERLFLACGPLATARLVLGSLPAAPRRLLTQPYFVLPVLLDDAPHGAPEPDAHTLAQVFLELADPAVSRRLVHLQLYGHNPVIAARLAAAAAWTGPFAGAVRARLSPRLMAIQGYGHSDEAAPATVEPSGRGEDCRLAITAGPAAPARALFARVRAKLAGLRRELGWRALPVGARLGLPGEGNHCGGLFPMKDAPGPLDTDRTGRPGGRGRVHLCDASILPSLPAATFTYAVMANASRAATEALEAA
jgi:hypothetical protein